MQRPLLSVITPTWDRPELLGETVEHLRDQDYPSLEHIMVSDGPDERVRAICAAEAGHSLPVRYLELGRNWSGELPVHSLGVAPLLAGMLLARGTYLAWLCDDERFTELTALSLLVDRLEATESDFVYPLVRMWRTGTTPERGWTIGTDPPTYGQFTWCVFRADILRLAMPRFHGPTFNDADLMERWLAAGARWSLLDRVLVTHRADR